MAYVEKYAPILFATVSVFALFWWKAEIQLNASSGKIIFIDLYAAVFDWSAIQTGFLFAIFGYVAGKKDGFIEAVKHTTHMTTFLGYQRSAIALGFMITFFSIPLMVMGFKVHASDGAYWIFCLWAFISIWGFFSFARVAYLFGLLIRPKDNESLPG